MQRSFPDLGDFARALDDAGAAAEAAGRKLTALSISQPGLDQLTRAVVALGLFAATSDLVSLFVGLPIIVHAVEGSSVAVIDDHDRIYALPGLGD